MSLFSPLLPEDKQLWEQLCQSFAHLLECMQGRPNASLSNAMSFHRQLTDALRVVGTALHAVGLQDCMDEWDWPVGHGSYARNLLQLTRDPSPEAVARLLAQDAREAAFFDRMRRVIYQFVERLLAATEPRTVSLLYPNPTTATPETALTADSDVDGCKAALAPEQNLVARPFRDRAGSAKEEPASKAVQKPTVPLRSWTQPDLDGAIREYKAKRAAQYKVLVEATRQGRPGAKQAAQRLFGRNAIAKALGVKARAMVSKSEPWQEIAAELQLPHNCKGPPALNGSKRIGLSIAEEQKVFNESGKAEVLDQLIHKETRALLQRELPPEAAEEVIRKLQREEMTDDGARELIDLYRLQQQDVKAEKVRRAP
jgi:hypothetical protein